MGLFQKKRRELAASDPDVEATEKSQADAPWVLAAARFEDRYLRLAAHAANWRRFAFLNLALSFMAVAGVVYIGSQSKIEPYVVEVDKLGRTLAVRALTGEDAITDPRRLVYREICDLFENLRTVTTDVAANNANLNKGFSRLKGSAAEYVRTELRKAPPNEVGKGKTVQVLDVSALPISAKVWQVEWKERSTNLKGEDLGTEHWKATIRVELEPSDKVEEFRKNPIGFGGYELNWQKQI